MPIKWGKIENAQFYIEQDGEYKPIGHVSESDFQIGYEDDSEEHELWECYLSPKSLELTVQLKCNPRALYIFLKTGNDLYIRFPKKLRRKK